MSSMNTVIAGNYEGRNIQKVGKELHLSTSLTEYIPLDYSTVQNYRKVENARGLIKSAIGGVYIEITFKGGNQSILLLTQNNYDLLKRNCCAPDSSNKKKSKKYINTLVKVFVGIFVFGLFVSIFSGGVGENEETSSAQSVPIVFDASKYEVKDDGSNITEAALIAELGQPDNIEEWNYDRFNGTYVPIRTLIYGNVRYNFNNDNLHRITIEEPIEYTDKANFLSMFGLKEYANSVIEDTNSSYRAFNCGIHDLWLQYEDGVITHTAISYSDLFSK